MTSDTKIDPERAPGSKMRTPPYVAYKTFLTLLGEFKENGIPPQVDRSVLKRFAGGIQGQLMLAMRSLDVIDGDNKPKPQLKALVDALDTDAFKEEMERILRATYPYVFALDLMTATPTMFADAFKDANDAKEDVLRKCRTFFFHAAKDVGIAFGPRLEQATFPRPRNSGGTRKAKPAQRKQLDENANGGGAFEEREEQRPQAVIERLLGKFPDFDPSWPDEIKKQWFEGFDRFMSGAGMKKKGDV